MYCKQCGKEIPDGSAFCAACGAPVSTGERSAQPGAASSSDANGSDAYAPEQAARQATPAAEKKKRFCTRCGREIPDGSTFCAACGAPVSRGAIGTLRIPSFLAAPTRR